MSITLTGHSPLTFEIKGASLSLLTLRLKSADLDALAAELQKRYGEMSGFFAEDLLLIDLTPLPEKTAALDFARLKTLLTACHLQPVAVAGGAPELMASALAAGLPAATDWRSAQPPPSSSLPQQNPPKLKPERQQAEPPVAPGALVIDKPLRSGQQVYARGRDLVLLAVCNPGAEAIADGHVHVYAPLRGRAIAGARGWGEARIFALDMRPELVSIAGIYRTSDQSLAPEVWGHPASVHLAATEGSDKLVFESLT